MVKEIPLTQGKVALVDDEDYEKIKDVKFYAVKSGDNWYVRVNISQMLHRLLLNPKPNEFCDHINGDGLDNRRCNLRIANHSQNQMNKKKSPHKNSRFKGVRYDKNRKSPKKWRASIILDGKLVYLGYYINEVDAAKAYDEAAKRLFGEYAKLNFEYVDINPNSK